MGVADMLSIQLYTLRAMGDLERILETVAQAGYRRVETTGGHLDDAAGTARALAAHKLAAPSGHTGLAALRERPDAVAEACRVLGCGLLVMPSVPQEQRRMGMEGWRSLGRELGMLAERMAGRGLQLAYHNHDWELLAKEDGRTALEHLFEAAGSSSLAWEADVAWLVRGGADPVIWLDRYAPRLAAAHVKDIAPAGQNLDQDGWADVGSGVLDWRTLWTACVDRGARLMVVEHDRPADPAATARNSLRYLTSLAA